mgnify:FL=1
MKRLPYILCIVVLFLLSLLLQFMVYENQEMALLAIALGLVLSVFAIVCHVKRFQDSGTSGWYVLLFFIPIVNLGVLLYLVCAPSASGIQQETTS